MLRILGSPRLSLNTVGYPSPKVPSAKTIESIIPVASSLERVWCRTHYASWYPLKAKTPKSWFLNNIMALLKRGLSVTFSNHDSYNNGRESIYQVYKDLWRTKEVRDCLVARGIANTNENTRKLMSGDDTGSGTGNAQNVSDKLMADTFKSDIEVPLDTIFKNLVLFPPYGVKFRVKYVVTFPPLNEIMVAQSSQTIAGYELSN